MVIVNIYQALLLLLGYINEQNLKLCSYLSTILILKNIVKHRIFSFLEKAYTLLRFENKNNLQPFSKVRQMVHGLFTAERVEHKTHNSVNSHS